MELTLSTSVISVPPVRWRALCLRTRIRSRARQMLWAKWGLKDRLLKDLDIWTCYYCGDCSTRCPAQGGARRDDDGAAPLPDLAVRLDGDLQTPLHVSATRDRCSRRAGPARGRCSSPSPVRSAPRECPPITFRWAPSPRSDGCTRSTWLMAAVLTFFLLTNTYRMWRMVMEGVNAPLSAYVCRSEDLRGACGDPEAMARLRAGGSLSLAEALHLRSGLRRHVHAGDVLPGGSPGRHLGVHGGEHSGVRRSPASCSM